jgi:hypothetical protein
MRSPAQKGGLIDQTIARLAAGLPGGTAGSRNDLLLEARHGLEDAAEAYREAGLSERAAVERAVSEFGEVEELRGDYAAQAMTGSVRLAALVLGAGYLLVLTAWLVASETTPDRLPGGSEPVANSFGWIGGLAVMTTVGVLAGVRRQARRSQHSSALAWTIGLLGLLCGAATLVASYLVEPWGARGDTTDTPASLVSLVEIFSGGMIFAIVACSLRCLWSAWTARATRYTRIN